MLYLSPSDVDQARFADAKPEIEVMRFGSVFPEHPACIRKDRLGIR